MYYIVSSSGYRVRIAYIMADQYGCETRVCSLDKRLYSRNEAVICGDHMCKFYMPFEKRKAEKNLYNDSDMKMCWNPKEFGEGKCSTQS